MFFEAVVILLAAPFIPFLAVCFVLAILNVNSSKVPCEMIVTPYHFEKAPVFSEMLAPNWSKMWSAHNITCQSKFKAVAGQALFPGASH